MLVRPVSRTTMNWSVGLEYLQLLVADQALVIAIVTESGVIEGGIRSVTCAERQLDARASTLRQVHRRMYAGASDCGQHPRRCSKMRWSNCHALGFTRISPGSSCAGRSPSPRFAETGATAVDP